MIQQAPPQPERSRGRQPAPAVDAQGLARDLRHAIAGEVRFDNGSRALYSTDASNYRQIPIGVVVPRTTDDVAQTLEYGTGAPQPWKRWIKWIVAALVVALIGYFMFLRGGSGDVRYVTQEVTQGNLTVTVTATGNLEPRNQVDIGVELSGTVRAVNVDVNDVVKKGDHLKVKLLEVDERGRMRLSRKALIEKN